MIKFYGFILSLFCCLASVHAQYYNGRAPKNAFDKVGNTWVEKGDLHLRWYPLGLVNFYDLNITVGSEVSYATNKSYIVDLGYVMASIYGSETGDLRPAKGGILKTTHRWYYGKKYKEVFLDAEAGLKMVKYKNDEQWVGRGVVNGVPAYEELMSFTSRKDVFFLGARLGKRIIFSPTSPVGLELWWGLGIRYRHYYPDLPDDAQVIQFQGWFFNPLEYDESWLPDLQMGLRLTWRAGGRKA
jgi:hypothetical protein